MFQRPRVTAREERLAELLPPLTNHEALVEANRCLFCYDAPCTHACPTHIDIPRFIKKISTDNVIGSAATILEANLLGATCARVCPVQELCEGACVLRAEHKPIMIGRLQRFATDHVAAQGIDVFKPGLPTGKSVAVVGAGPAGLSCAGELAKRGHRVTVFEKRSFSGGLSTYGIISLREPIPVSLAEVEAIGRLGVEFRTGTALGQNLELSDLGREFEAVFLAVGLGATPALEIPGEEHIVDGLQYIEASKMGRDALQIGRQVAVIGAGNTAIDCATVARRLGAERVTIVYRRTASEMSAYPHEFEFAKAEGIEFRFLAQPTRVVASETGVAGLECASVSLGQADGSGRPAPRPVTGSEFIIPADQIVKAIGQEKWPWAGSVSLATDRGFLRVNEEFETSLPGVYAGGDSIRARGSCSTVMAVQDGKLAAAAIHRKLAVSNEEEAAA
ncbi:MAG: NAD(P)-dependent oxidoreductase [Bryobacteraceae bacterium]